MEFPIIAIIFGAIGIAKDDSKVLGIIGLIIGIIGVIFLILSFVLQVNNFLELFSGFGFY